MKTRWRLAWWRLRLAWRILRGQPTAYRIHIDFDTDNTLLGGVNGEPALFHTCTIDGWQVHLIDTTGRPTP